ncbi:MULTISPECIES: ABC transporter ATP-binding protein [Paenibacillus]|uniref:ABC transporter ATP-binding protein n=1 Tax=Paenibacillus naphthalenovorans TaxID=162209 RepID=A0A0U2W9I1_9BACL|nr:MULTISPECIES: ABC transporter ATP-binding protein [Paenibacillus]ALS23102.1 ABC transporter ATP-binding protein [Paenibacillus naphthalenovorans]GCL71837.1 ABC transporter ATP-binding protein [Paenibacillus naphthalenovorans]
MSLAVGQAVAEGISSNQEQPQPKLSVENLMISYENHKSGETTEAVHNVSLDIKPGEFVTIVGLSGCGKSSFLNAVAGLLKASGGTIRIDGKPVQRPGPDRAVVFQKASLLPWRTTLKNITYGLEIMGIPKREAVERARKYIKMAKLEDYENFYPSALSGGMQQRVNLARALACEPQVLLMDEPFSALDAITREGLQNELLLLWELTKKTVLMVTHQIDEAVLLSDRVIVFSPRPAVIVKEIRIDLPRPRTPEVKQNPYFDQLTQRVWSAINKSAGKRVNQDYEI